MSLEEKTTVVYETQFQSKGFEKMQQQMSQLQKNFNLALNKLNNNMKLNNKLQKNNTAATEAYRDKIMGLKRSMIAFFFVAREMKALLSPAAQLVGIFDVWNTILQVTFLPIMMFVMQYVMIPLLNLFTSLAEPVQFVLGLIVSLGSVLGGIYGVLTLLGIAVGSAFWPVTLTIAAIVAGAALIIKYWGPISDFFTNLGSGISDIMVNIKDSIVKAMQDAYDWVISIWNGLASWFNTNVSSPITTFINLIIDGINSIISMLPDWIKNDFGIKTIEHIGKIELPKIPTYTGPSFESLANGTAKQSSVVINQTNNISGLTTDQVSKQLAQNNKDIFSKFNAMCSTTNKI